MKNYYSRELSAERLKFCYDIAPPRVKQYLEAEIDFILDRVRPDHSVLELGCGYGRVLLKIAQKVKFAAGIDSSRNSLILMKNILSEKDKRKIRNCSLYEMNAAGLGFKDRVFNTVLCIQNGISAFNVNRQELMKEAVRVTSLGGLVIFSSYSEKFWEDRLEWFKIQSKYGLIGEIDYNATKNGIIVSKDGFKATTISPLELRSLASKMMCDYKVMEIDDSSIICEMRVVNKNSGT